MYYLYKDADNDYVLADGGFTTTDWYTTPTEALAASLGSESTLNDAVHPLLLVASGETRDATRDSYPELFI